MVKCLGPACPVVNLQTGGTPKSLHVPDADPSAHGKNGGPETSANSHASI